MSDGNEGASRGFPPISAPGARVLVLGSLPGARSIAEQQYYAHPQNAFWRIMRELYGVDGSYEERCRQLTGRGVALWDVLERSHRPGSMDADIDLATARPNDFETFLVEQPGVTRICFNGRKAESMFRRFFPRLNAAGSPQLVGLPSTSPAFASMSFEDKLARWRAALNPDGALAP
jgi:hypoxanthine-DNA glycosylase